MKSPRLELLAISFLIFGLQILFVRTFHLFFTELDAQALIPWSFLGILISCLLLAADKHPFVKRLIHFLNMRFVFVILVLYGVSCFFLVHHLSALLMVVLVNLGLGMCLANAAMKMEAYRFYLFDFLGGIAGCVVAFFLPNWFNLEFTYVFFSGIALSAIFLSPSVGNKKFDLLTATALIVGLVYLALNPLKDLSQYGALYQKPEDSNLNPKRHGQLQMQVGHQNRVFSRWSSVGKIEATTSAVQPSDIEFFVNNINYFSLSKSEDRTKGDFGKNKRALVIGAGGGLEMRFLRDQGFQDITAVEINEVVYDLMRHRFAVENENVFNQSHFILGEGRNFAEQEKSQYDIIVINYVGNAGGLIGSSDDLSENYLFTQEAFNTYFRRLKTGGLLAIGLVYSKNPSPNPLLLRTIETAAQVLRTHQQDPEDQIWVLGQERRSASLEHRKYRGLMVLRQGEVTSDQLQAESSFIKDMRAGFSFANSHAIVHPPGIKIDFAQPQDLLTQQELLAQAATRQSIAEDVLKNYDLNIFPAHDDRPYFFQFDGHPHFPLKPGRVLFWVCLAFIAAMLWLLARSPAKILQQKGNSKILVLSGLLGLGYGILEIALLNSFTIAFSSMTWNFSLMVFGLLSGAVVAGAFGSKLSDLHRKIIICFSALCLGSLCFVNFKSYLFSFEDGYLRSIILIAGTLLISCGISLAYPLLLKNCEGEDDRMPAFVLGINSGFFILGSLVCRYLALVLSLKHAFLIAAIIYLVVVALLPAAKGNKPSLKF